MSPSAKLLWRLYFVAVSLELLGTWGGVAYQRWSLSTSPLRTLLPGSWGELVFWACCDLVAVIGLGGFVLERGVFREAFWRVWAPCYVVVLLAQAIRSGAWWVHLPFGFSVFEAVLFSSLGLAFMTPAVVALFSYGRRRPRLWHPGDDAI